MDHPESNGPVHPEQSNLLDSPDYWLDEADQVIESLRLENQILINENKKLKAELSKYQTTFIGLGLELDKLSESK